MLENRSFDHMLGYLYSDNGNVSPAGHPFDGLTGAESNTGPDGTEVSVFPIGPDTENGYFMPGANPGEGYAATNRQLFGSVQEPVPATATMRGFVADFAQALQNRARAGAPIVDGTRPGDIMGCFTPQALPVLSGLARGFAVCDRWFSSVPGPTLPNRAFAWAGTSQGQADDVLKSYKVPTIFGALDSAGLSWAIYGDELPPLTRHAFADISDAFDSHFGVFTNFQEAAAAGRLPALTVLEPSWDAAGSSQHPPFNVAVGEHLIQDVYYTLRDSPNWEQTLLIITYDEHGGCYDHVAPPANAIAPDSSPSECGFGFTRFGVRVPTVLVSPLIAGGAVFRSPEDGTPLDHTSILSTVQARWGLPPLTRRDAAAPDVGPVLSLAEPRMDDPLSEVVPPVFGAPPPGADDATYLQLLHARLLDQGSPGHDSSALATMSSQEVNHYIRLRAGC